MLRLPATELPAAAQAGLTELQTEIDTLPTYEARVQAAKATFSQRNKATNPVFREVRAKLGEMAGGLLRCAYCEDSVADEVEHIRPKDLYPDAVFTWTNYLYACGPCNGPKNNGFAIVEQAAGLATAKSVARKRTDPVVPPPDGPPALIDPRAEDPLQHLVLDLSGTWRFVPSSADGSTSHVRAVYTTQLLNLNNRDNLPRARRSSYRAYRALLREYVEEKQQAAPADRLDELEEAIRELPHRTVWAEMQRQQDRIPELQALFAAAPEALDW
jgi:uncharacterized protein (TIGR02646 family)